MAHGTQTKPSTGGRRTRSQTPGDTILMLPLVERGFEDLKLPPGVQMATVTPNRESLEQIEKQLSAAVKTVRDAIMHGGTVKVPGFFRWRSWHSSGKNKEHYGKLVHVGAPVKAGPQDPRPNYQNISEKAFEPDARSQALLEGVRIAQEDLRKAGGAFDLQQVRTLLGGITRQAIDKRVQEGSLLAVPGPSNRRSYPTLQFKEDGSVVAGLKEVRDALPTTNPWVILNFLAQPDARLDGKKPIDVLKSRDIKLAVEAARRLGKQGA